MQLLDTPTRQWAILLSSALLAYPTLAVPVETNGHGGDGPDRDPFAVLDPQNWVNPDNMTWDDWLSPPDTNWADPSVKGSVRNFNIALVTVDYPDMPFVITLDPGSTVFGNPQPSVSNYAREDVPTYYHDFLNKPGEINKGRTLHEYWMGDSMGRYGVDLTAFGPYKLPLKSFQYGLDDWMNAGSCPDGEKCNVELRDDALGSWRADVGNDTANSYELVFILSAGQDESSTWQEFGEMKFLTPDDVPAEFGPPSPVNGTDNNWATTRYVPWSSWAAASCIWPNADGSSSTQSESSGMGTFAHELSHLLDIGDNYNNPYGDPPRRAYTGPWSMLSRGSFNGPGGPHTRWQIPPVQGGSMGSHHTVRDKLQIGLAGNESVLSLSRNGLADSGIVVARLISRAVAPGKGELMGLRVAMDTDNSPACDVEKDPFCDGGGYDTYYMEVIDRMGADSFVPDSGVMISKTKPEGDGAYQWTIDANPENMNTVDFYRPDGTPSMISIGDYRQLVDALFHAGTRSGSEYEYVDEANRLHFYIIDAHRDKKGILSYTAAVRSLDSGKAKKSRQCKLDLGRGKVTSGHGNNPTGKGVTCSFKLRNTSPKPKSHDGSHPQDASKYLQSDVYRLEASVEGKGWKVELLNALATAESGKSTTVKVAVAAEKSAVRAGKVKLTVTSESDASVSQSAFCIVDKD
ncbi:hypothetical protein FQN51_001983 [Onygenales sp. PD_10]|nr:hypothetical protein FQN51_001983 [Onygenales sp. PD_10]